MCPPRVTTFSTSLACIELNLIFCFRPPRFEAAGYTFSLINYWENNVFCLSAVILVFLTSAFYHCVLNCCDRHEVIFWSFVSEVSRGEWCFADVYCVGQLTGVWTQLARTVYSTDNERSEDLRVTLSGRTLYITDAGRLRSLICYHFNAFETVGLFPRNVYGSEARNLLG